MTRPSEVVTAAERAMAAFGTDDLTYETWEELFVAWAAETIGAVTVGEAEDAVMRAWFNYRAAITPDAYRWDPSVGEDEIAEWRRLLH